MSINKQGMLEQMKEHNGPESSRHATEKHHIWPLSSEMTKENDWKEWKELAVDVATRRAGCSAKAANGSTALCDADSSTTDAGNYSLIDKEKSFTTLMSWCNSLGCRGGIWDPETVSWHGVAWHWLPHSLRSV